MLAVLLAAGAVRAETVASTILGEVGGTRARAMAGAASALSGDPTLAWLNPASSADVNGTGLTLAGQRGVFGQSMGQMMLCRSMEFTGVMFAGVSVDDSGATVMPTLSGGFRKVSLQRDYLAVLGYARTGDLADWGVTVKGLRSELLGDYSANAAVLDLGVQRQVLRSLRAAVTVQNLGTKIKYFETASPLPATARAGLAYDWKWWHGLQEDSPANVVTVVADADYSIYENVTGWQAGAEYSWRGIASLRGGVKGDTRENLGLYCLGIGLSTGRYRLDYSIDLGGDIGYPQSLSLTITFGTVLHGVSVSIPFERNTAMPAPESKQALESPPKPVVAPPVAGVKKTMNATMEFAPRGLDLKVPIKEWKAVVTDKYNRVVKTIVGVGTPPKELEWDGLDDRGRPVVDLSTAKISLNMKDAVGKPIEANWTIPVASAEPQLRTIASPLADSEVKFGMPQRNFQCWQLQVKDGPVDVASWEGEGIPATQITWSGVDSSGKPWQMKEPVFSWQFIGEDGNPALGERKLPQVEAVIEEVKEGRSVRLIGVGFAGGDTDLTGEHWAALEKAAKLIQKNPENTLVIESYSEGASEEKSTNLAKIRGQNVLAALTEQFQVNSPKIIINSHGSSDVPPQYPEYSGGSRRQRIDLVVIERK